MIEILKHNPEYQNLEQGWDRTGLFFSDKAKAEEYQKKTAWIRLGKLADRLCGS